MGRKGRSWPEALRNQAVLGQGHTSDQRGLGLPRRLAASVESGLAGRSRAVAAGTLSAFSYFEISLECLVLAEVGDRKSQGIDGDEFVRNLGSEDEDKVCGVEVALHLAVVRG